MYTRAHGRANDSRARPCARVHRPFTCVHGPHTRPCLRPVNTGHLRTSRVHGRIHGPCPCTAVYGTCPRPCTGRDHGREHVYMTVYSVCVHTASTWPRTRQCTRLFTVDTACVHVCTARTRPCTRSCIRLRVHVHVHGRVRPV